MPLADSPCCFLLQLGKDSDGCMAVQQGMPRALHAQLHPRTIVDVSNGPAPTGPVLVSKVEQGGGCTSRATMDHHPLQRLQYDRVNRANNCTQQRVELK